MYGHAERTVGALAQALGVGEQLFVASKIWTSGRAAGERQLAATRAYFHRQRMDLMQVHNLLDTETHLRTLRAARDRGEVRHLGVSHYTACAHAELEGVARSGEVQFIQINYSLAEPGAGRRLLDAAAAAGVAVLINRPFAEGAMFARVRGRQLPDWAAELECATHAQLFLKWILAHPAVTCVLTGTRNPRHLLDNLGAGRGRLPDAGERRRIEDWWRAL
jgi:diketogulonate reductase-like aldo/keto reductase